MDGVSFHEALPNISGQWCLETETLEEASRDFGKVEYQRPIAVLRPGCVDDIGGDNNGGNGTYNRTGNANDNGSD